MDCVLTLTVCGDAPVRLVDLVALHVAATVDAMGASWTQHVPSAKAKAAFVQGCMQTCALLLGGAARASEVNDVSTSITAGHVNSSIASAKRILVADLNLRLNLTLFQCYRVGTCGIPKSYETTPWHGTYGAGFDIGTSASIGIKASSITADRRNHGKILMSGAQVDEWCATIARNAFVQVDGAHYAPRPRETCGVPHVTVPGVHRYLDHYVGALERSRALLGLSRARTVDSLQMLTLGPFAERQSPHIGESSDVTATKRFRNAVDRQLEGRAFQADATAPDVALFREPLIPLAAITTAGDNVFAQPQPWLSSAFGAAALLAQLARTVDCFAAEHETGVRSPSRVVEGLFALLDAFYMAPNQYTPAAIRAHRKRVPFFLAAVAGVVLNAIFPSAFGLGELAICEGHARAPAACAACMRLEAATPPAPSSVGGTLQELLPVVDVAKARAFWAPFGRLRRLSPWSKLAPLLELFLHTDGALDLDLKTLDAFSAAFDGLVRQGAWLHASADGEAAPTAPHPLAGLHSSYQVRSEHVVPSIVPRTLPTGGFAPARGALVGLPRDGVAATAGAADGRRDQQGDARKLRQQLRLPVAAPERSAGHPHDQEQGSVGEGHLGAERRGRRGGLRHASGEARGHARAARGLDDEPRPRQGRVPAGCPASARGGAHARKSGGGQVRAHHQAPARRGGRRNCAGRGGVAALRRSVHRALSARR